MWFFLVILGVIAGLTDYDWPPTQALLLLAFLAFLLIAGAGKHAARSPLDRFRIGLGVVILAYLWTNVYLAASFNPLLPTFLSGESLSIEGRVVEVRRDTGSQQQLVFQVASCQRIAYAGACGFSGRVVLNRYLDPDDMRVLPAQAHERWRFIVRLYSVRGFSNRGQSRYRLSQLAQGIHARGYVYREAFSALLEPAKGFYRLRRQWQQTFTQQVERLSTGFTAPHHLRSGTALSDKDKSFIERVPLVLARTLLTGQSERLDTRHWQLLRETGTLHLVVVSGLHIGVLLTFGWFLLSGVSRVLALDRHRQRLMLRVAPVLLILPMLLIWPSGVAVSRALMMALLLLLMRAVGIRLSPARILLTVVMFLLLMQPLYLIRPGFYYSVWAVALLLLVVSSGRYRGLFLTIQLVLLLGLLPLQAYWLNTPDLAAGLANLVAIPLVSLVIMPLALLVMVLPWQPLIDGLAALDQLFWQWLALCLDIAWGVPVIGWGLALLLLIAALVLALPGLPGKAVWLLAVAVGLTLLPVNESTSLSVKRPRQMPDPFSVEVFDVGQGLAVLIRASGKSLLYDTGPGFRSGFMPIGMLLPPRLRTQREMLDLLVVSHDDNDHAGGVPALSGFYHEILAGQPGRLTFQGLLSADRITRCEAGMSRQWQDIQIRVLYPPAGILPGQADNRYSCVLHIASRHDPEQSILLTGDIDTEAERWLLTSGQVLKAHWLVASHHGSAGGNSLAFLARVQPEGIIYSAGYRNRYGHPARAVQKRLSYLRQSHQDAVSAAKTVVEPGRWPRYREYNTADMGALFLTAPRDGRGWQLTGQRETLPLRWQWQK